MFLTQDRFLNQIHVPYSTLVEYSNLLDHHYSSSSFCTIICHLLQNLSLFHTILLVPYATYICIIKCSPHWVGIYWSPEHAALASSAIIPFCIWTVFLTSPNQTKQVVPETYPSTRVVRHHLGTVWATLRFRTVWALASLLDSCPFCSSQTSTSSVTLEAWISPQISTWPI